MRGYYSSAIVALVTTSAIVASLGALVSDCFECPADKVTRLANPEDCHSYYICKNGKKIIYWCPEGLVYNRILQQCDWPKLSGKKCITDNVGTQPDDPDVPDDPDLPGENKPVVGECFGECPDSNPIDRTVHIPVYKDCTKFCSCSNGTPILQECPKNLHFDQEKQVCNWPQSAKCPWK